MAELNYQEEIPEENDRMTGKELPSEAQITIDFLNGILDALDTPLLIKDENLRIILSNQAACEFFKRSREEVPGKTDFDLFPAEQAVRFSEYDRLVLKTGQMTIREDEIRQEDKKRTVSVKRCLYSGQNPVKKYLICSLHELSAQHGNALKEAITQQSELKARLQRAEKLESIGILAGGVAHDLNNILAALVGYPDILLNELPADSPLREPIMAMRDSGQRAAAVVQDLLALSRQGFTQTIPLNLNTIVKEYLRSLHFNKMISRNSNITFLTKLHDNLDNILGCATHLTKTLMNLITNAVDAIQQTGTISIETFNCSLTETKRGYEDIVPGNFTVLRIADTGHGIQPCDLERIFEPFYTKKLAEKNGTGLGLAVVWGTVKEHNGFIDVQSSPEQGTVFELYFPLTRQPVALEPYKPAINDYLGNGEKILVIDDISEQRDIAARILSRLGYFVVTVSDGGQGIAYLKKYKVALILIDMILEPGPDGLDTYMEILKFNPRQKAIIISGYSESERVKQAQSLGALEYVKKPYTLETLGLAVKRGLGKGLPEELIN